MSQRVLVTGAASGIGLEIARAFSVAGSTVFITDINEQALDAARKELPALLTRVCDSSKRSDIESMVPAAVEGLGGLDVLVNNAGISGPTAPVEGVDPDAWDTVLNVNLTGTFHVTRLAIPHLKPPASRGLRRLRPVPRPVADVSGPIAAPSLAAHADLAHQAG